MLLLTSFENGPCYSIPSANGSSVIPGGNCAPNPRYNNTNVADLRGKTLPNAPKIKLNLGAQYDLPLPARRFDAFFTAAYRPDFKDAGLVPQKQPGCKVLLIGSEAVEIDPRLAPRRVQPALRQQGPRRRNGDEPALPPDPRSTAVPPVASPPLAERCARAGARTSSSRRTSPATTTAA